MSDPTSKSLLLMEQSVLGALLANARFVEGMPEGFGAGHFLFQGHAEIFEAVKAAARAGALGAVSVLVCPAVEPLGVEPEYVFGLLANATSYRPEDARAFAEGLMAAAERRELSALGLALQREAEGVADDGSFPDPGAVAARAAEGLERLREGSRSAAGAKRAWTLDEAMDAGIAAGEEAHRTGGVGGVPMGFHCLDARIGGMKPTRIYLLAGRPGSAKSGLGVQIAIRAARWIGRDDERRRGLGQAPLGGGVGVISLEMEGEQIGQRALALASGVGLEAIGRGEFAGDTRLADAVLRGRREYEGLPILIQDEGNLTPQAIKARAKAMAKRLGGLRLLVVDHFHIVGEEEGRGGRENENAALTRRSGLFKALAKEMHVPLLVLCQLSRDVEKREDKRPNSADLRGCVHGDTRIRLADGTEAPIRSLVGTKPRVVSVTDDHRIVAAESDLVWSTGRKPVVRVRTKGGREIVCTPDHRLMGAMGWAPASSFESGDRIASPLFLPPPPDTEECGDDRLVLLAHMIGDGSYLPRQPVRMTTGRPANSEAAAAAALSAFGVVPGRHEGPTGTWHQLVFGGSGNRWHPTGIRQWFRDIGIYGQRSHQKTVPDFVFRLPDRKISLFLRHLWATDGHYFAGGKHDHAPAIVYTSTSRRLVEQVADLLLRLRVPSRMGTVPQGRHRTSHNVTVSGAEPLGAFLGAVGAFGDREPAAEAIRARIAGVEANTNVDTAPKEWWPAVFGAVKAAGHTSRSAGAAMGTATTIKRNMGFAPSRTFLRRLGAALPSAAIAAMAEKEVFWDTVASVEDAGEDEVFDLTVPGPSCAVMNGIVAHNSGALEQDADVITFIHRPEMYAQNGPERRQNEREETFGQRLTDWENYMAESRGVAELISTKVRQGRPGLDRLRFDGERVRFHEEHEV